MTEKEQQTIFGSWIGQYKGLFYKIARAYARDEADMDDLYQEMALQVWRSIPAFKGASSESTWIYRVAINSALNWMRKERRHRRVEGIGDAVLVLADSEGFSDGRLAWLYRAIQELEVVDRSIALLLLEGFSYKEMAAIIGIPTSHIGVKVLRIKKQLIIQSKKTDHHGI